MYKRSRTLRALVTERLSAAAEEIFQLVERTIAEYEEELCRCRAEKQQLQEENRRNQQLLEENRRNQQLLEENQRNQQLLEENQRNQQLHRTDSQKPFLSHIPETLQRNEERPEHGTDLLLSVKSEEQPSPIQPGQTDDDWEPAAADWEPAAGVSTAQTQTQTAADGDRYSQVRTDSSPAARDSAPFNTSDTGKHECSFCSKRFITKQRLQVHTRVHTGERPFSCTVCNEAFAAKGHLKDHMRVHTGEKPYSCSICERTFARQFTLQGHMRTHTGERPYSCSECDATFAQRPHLTKHMLKHTHGHD